MYKAVFIDIDKTLLDGNGEVTQATANVIERAQKKGIHVLLISGRSRMSAIKFQEFSSRYMINCNGADIYDTEKKETLYQSAMEPKSCKKLYEMAQKEDMVIKLDFGLARAVNKPAYLESYEIELTENIDDFLKNNKVIQMAVCNESLEKIENLKKYIKENTIFEVINQFIWEVNGKVMQAIHITNTGISKGNAMAGLCKFLGIDLSQTVAIGDKINDISMIKMAGFGVAMGNATKEVKQIADFVTTSNEEDGVAKVLEKVLEEK